MFVSKNLKNLFVIVSCIFAVQSVIGCDSGCGDTKNHTWTEWSTGKAKEVGQAIFLQAVVMYVLPKVVDELYREYYYYWKNEKSPFEIEKEEREEFLKNKRIAMELKKQKHANELELQEQDKKDGEITLARKKIQAMQDALKYSSGDTKEDLQRKYNEYIAKTIFT